MSSDLEKDVAQWLVNGLTIPISTLMVSGDPTSLPALGTLGVTFTAGAVAPGMTFINSLKTKRAHELFKDEEFTLRVVGEMKKSDDFASFVIDLTQRHLMQSSETRRNYLKAFLKNTMGREDNDYINFSRIHRAIEDISLEELRTLEIINKSSSPVPPNATDDPTFRQIDIYTSLGYDRPFDEVSGSVEQNLNNLSSLGLLTTRYGLMDGNIYHINDSGKLFLEYIKS